MSLIITNGKDTNFALESVTSISFCVQVFGRPSHDSRFPGSQQASSLKATPSEPAQTSDGPFAGQGTRQAATSGAAGGGGGGRAVNFQACALPSWEVF